jgi:hypothetical protein
MTEQTAAPADTTDGASGSSPLTTADIASGANAGTGTVAETRPAGSETTPLFPQDRLDGYRRRWADIQASFVDDPRQATEQADNLVATVIKDLAEVFAQERQNLEGQWTQGQDVSTEDLRIALMRYRSFFDRLLSL